MYLHRVPGVGAAGGETVIGGYIGDDNGKNGNYYNGVSLGII